MIKKIVFITLILSSVSYAYNVNTLNNEPSPINKEQKISKSWPSDITNNISGETCQDGNCIKGSKCVTKVSKKIKRLCKKF